MICFTPPWASTAGTPAAAPLTPYSPSRMQETASARWLPVKILRHISAMVPPYSVQPYPRRSNPVCALCRHRLAIERGRPVLLVEGRRLACHIPRSATTGTGYRHVAEDKGVDALGATPVPAPAGDGRSSRTVPSTWLRGRPESRHTCRDDVAGVGGHQKDAVKSTVSSSARFHNYLRGGGRSSSRLWPGAAPPDGDRDIGAVAGLRG